MVRNIRGYAVCLSFLLCLYFLSPLVGIHQVEAAPPAMQTSAEAAALIDVESGRILWSHQGEKRMLVASTTKIMTTIVAIEHGDLASQVTVSDNAFGVEGSSLYLKRGEKMNLEHMLYGLMLRSGNDAATAIAEHVGGSVEGFAQLMNEKAASIGMADSHFTNPHGLNADEHYSTAEDMSRLAAYALKNTTFKEIVKTKIKKVPNPNEKWDYTWYNKNKMLAMYDGADGVKTGYTKKAGRCLVSSATKDGRQLAVVTLNASSDWADHSSLLDYGFNYYSLERFAEKGTPLEQHPELVIGISLTYALAEGEIEHITNQVTLHETDSVNYRLGEAGRIDYYLDEQRIGSVPLYEKDSPRLQDSLSRSTFQFTKLPVKRPYHQVLFSVLKGLFEWSM